MEMRGDCWSCGQPLATIDYQRESRCPGCQKATRVCRNCRFYRPGVNNDCAEPIAEYVTDKTRANFCDYFEPTVHTTGPSRDHSPDDLLAVAKDLFKN